MDTIRRKSLKQRARINKENIKEYDNEKRAKELASRGFNQELISGMMMIPEHKIHKMINHKTKEIIRDGEL